MINGTMARVLISSPIHARNQWELANVTVVPRPREMINTGSTFAGISKGRVLTYMVRE